MDQIGPKMDQKGLNIVFFYPKKTFFVEIWFAEHTLYEEIILNEVGRGESPHE